jgi:UDP-glucose 4-epimerase
MNSLLLDGNGFMGTHLTDRLLEDGHQVRVYDRSPNKFRALPKDAEYVEGELGNHGLILEALEGVEVVYHFVSTTLPKTSNDDPLYDVRSNLIDAIQLLESCVQAGVRKVVFASSGGTVYGVPKETPIREEHPTEPISSYGIVKLAIEKYLHLFWHLYGLDYAALRISNPYGPYQNPAGQQGVISVFLNRLYRGEPITIWGDGSVVRDYLYVSDVIEALELAGGEERDHKVFNIGSGVGVSLNELLHLVAEVVGECPKVEYMPGRALDVPASVLEVSRAEEELGWRPHTEIARGVALTWEWINSLSDAEVLE